MRHVIPTVILICVTLHHAVHGEVFSSAADMREVFTLENDLVNILSGYAAKLDAKLGRIKSYIKVRKVMLIEMMIFLRKHMRSIILNK